VDLLIPRKVRAEIISEIHKSSIIENKFILSIFTSELLNIIYYYFMWLQDRIFFTCLLSLYGLVLFLNCKIYLVFSRIHK